MNGRSASGRRTPPPPAAVGAASAPIGQCGNGGRASAPARRRGQASWPALSDRAGGETFPWRLAHVTHAGLFAPLVTSRKDTRRPPWGEHCRKAAGTRCPRRPRGVRFHAGRSLGAACEVPASVGPESGRLKRRSASSASKQIERNGLQHRMMSVLPNASRECSGAPRASYVVEGSVPKLHTEKTDNPVLAITQFQASCLEIKGLGGNTEFEDSTRPN